VETGDILTVAGGLIIVLIIALVANPQYLAGGMTGTPGEVLTVIPTLPPPVVTPILVQSPVPTARPTLTTMPTPVDPYRIFYTDKPFSYPAYKLPDTMAAIGESDIRRTGQESITFAYIEETRGGLTQVFSVPYPVWMLNITVTANRTPHLGNFRLALCYASNGTIVDGVEILNQGNAYKKIQTSNTNLYLIISTVGIDRYHIDLETPVAYYNQYSPK
jgi:hypothetical protein